MITTILLTLVCGCVTYLLYKHVEARHIRKFSKEISGPHGVFFFGNSFDLNLTSEGIAKCFIDWMNQYGPRLVVNFAWVYFFFTRKLTDVEKILSSSVHTTKGSDYEFLRPWLGDGILVSKGAKWAARRKLLTPAFHFKILEQFIPVFNKQTRTFCQVLDKFATTEEVFDVCPFISRCTLDIICETAMGKTINAQSNVDHEYLKATLAVNELFQYRAMRFWLQYDFIWYKTSAGKEEKRNLEILHGFANKVIAERKAELHARKSESMKTDTKTEDDNNDDVYLGKKKRPMAFMDLLLEHQFNDPTAISDAEIREETDTIMFAGHDTTAASASWTLYLLGLNLEHQEKVIEELDSVFGDDKTRDVTAQDVTQLKYLECCIKEALRIYPSAPFIGRTITEDFQLDDHTVIPKGTDTSVFIISVHNDATNFPEPEKYKPERFFLENSCDRNPYAFIPFSAGPRNCIGQKFALLEEKILLANFFRNYRCKSMEERDQIVLTAAIIARSKNGIKMTIKRR